jgi:integrase
MGSIRRAPCPKCRRADCRHPEARKAPWQARYRDPAGSQRTNTFDAKADARAFLSTVETELSRGQWIDPASGRVTYGEWSKEYFAGAVHKRATTLARDRSVNKKYFDTENALGDRQLGSITPLDVRRLVEQMTKHLAPATVRTNYGVLRAILHAAVEAELIAVSPCRGIRMPAESRRELRFLSADELGRLADATPPEYRPMIYLAGVVGLRWSEVVGLRVGRVDFLRRTLEITETCSEVEGKVIFADVKTKSSRRTLNLPPFLIEMLSEHLAARGRPGPDELVFVARKGGPLRRSTFRARVFDRAVRKAELDGVTFHGLRHSAVGLMIEVGAHLEVIKRRLGHASIRVTSDVYGSVLPEVDDAVTARLEEQFTTASEVGHRVT